MSDLDSESMLLISPYCHIRSLWFEQAAVYKRKPAVPNNIIVIEKADDFESCFDKHLRPDVAGCILGFDCEWVDLKNHQNHSQRNPKGWPPLNTIEDEVLRTTILESKVSLVQFSNCFGVSVLCRVGFWHKFPECMSMLIENPNILKVGVNIENDRRKLWLSFGVTLTGTCDLRSLTSKHPHFGVYHNNKTGLKELAFRMFGADTYSHVRHGNWNAEVLSSAQKQYAAFDSQSAVDIFLELAPIALKLWPISTIRPTSWVNGRFPQNGDPAVYEKWNTMHVSAYQKLVDKGHAAVAQYTYNIPCSELIVCNQGLIDLCSTIFELSKNLIARLTVPMFTKCSAQVKRPSKPYSADDQIYDFSEDSDSESDGYDDGLPSFRDSSLPDLNEEIKEMRERMRHEHECQRKIHDCLSPEHANAVYPNWNEVEEFLRRTENFDYYGTSSYRLFWRLHNCVFCGESEKFEDGQDENALSIQSEEDFIDFNKVISVREIPSVEFTDSSALQSSSTSADTDLALDFTASTITGSYDSSVSRFSPATTEGINGIDNNFNSRCSVQRQNVKEPFTALPSNSTFPILDFYGPMKRWPKTAAPCEPVCQIDFRPARLRSTGTQVSLDVHLSSNNDTEQQPQNSFGPYANFQQSHSSAELPSQSSPFPYSSHSEVVPSSDCSSSFIHCNTNTTHGPPPDQQRNESFEEDNNSTQQFIRHPVSHVSFPAHAAAAVSSVDQTGLCSSSSSWIRNGFTMRTTDRPVRPRFVSHAGTRMLGMALRDIHKQRNQEKKETRISS